MRRLLLAACCVVGFAPPLAAQPALRGELARLGFMLGEWRGTGWVRYAPDGPQRLAQVAAQGQPRLAGVVLGWNSTATSTDGQAAVVMQSDIGIRFRADSSVFRMSGSHGPARVEGWARAGECELSWGYASPADPQTLFRFSSRVAGTSRTETGERTADGGATWWTFYGAELSGPQSAACPPLAQGAAAQAPAVAAGTPR